MQGMFACILYIYIYIYINIFIYLFILPCNTCAFVYVFDHLFVCCIACDCLVFPCIIAVCHCPCVLLILVALAYS